MPIIWGDHKKQRDLKQIQPLVWDWEALFGVVSALLCALALWRGIIWAGIVIYRVLHG